MYIVVFQLIVYIIFTISVHYNAPSEMRIFSSIGAAFALISATVLLIDYFIQFAVVPISMMKGETEGIALMTSLMNNFMTSLMNIYDLQGAVLQFI